MVIGYALALLATAAPGPDPLAAAAEALARGDYDSAEAQALEAAAPPQEGEALDLAGAARFRAGRPGEALEAFERAGLAADPPPRGRWNFNRASCLYELGRFPEAEAAYLEAAADDPSLAGPALANAGFAAFDAGAPERARALARSAREAGGADGLTSDLEVLLGPVGEAPGQRPFRGSVHLGGGFDTNVLQSSASDRESVVRGRAQSAFLEAGLILRRRFPLHWPWQAEVAYGIEQLAYLDKVAEDESLQEHTLSVDLERPVGGPWRAGFRGIGILSFTGLSAFRGLLGGAAATAWAALDEGRWATLRMELGQGFRRGLRSEFQYLGGSRTELALTEDMRLGRIGLGVGYVFRLERLGTLHVDGTWTLPPNACESENCRQSYSIPVGDAESALTLSARAPLGDVLVLSGTATGEWRRYLSRSALRVEDGDALRLLDPVRRVDQRLLFSLAATLRPRPWLELSLHGEFSVNRSNVARGGSLDGCQAPDYRCHALDYDDKDYTRAVGWVDAAVLW